MIYAAIGAAYFCTGRLAACRLVIHLDLCTGTLQIRHCQGGGAASNLGLPASDGCSTAALAQREHRIPLDLFPEWICPCC